MYVIIKKEVVKVSKFTDEIKHRMIEEHISENKLSDMIGCSKTLLKKWLDEEEELPVIVSENIKKVLKMDKKENDDLNTKFDKLSDENKAKVLEYIEFLKYNQDKVLSKKMN